MLNLVVRKKKPLGFKRLTTESPHVRSSKPPEGEKLFAEYSSILSFEGKMSTTI
jgi:hypothetical protein